MKKEQLGARLSWQDVAGRKTTGDLAFRDISPEIPSTFILHPRYLGCFPPVRTVFTLTTGHGVAQEFPSTPAVGRCILALDLGEIEWGLASDVIPFHLGPFVLFDVHCACSAEGKHPEDVGIIDRIMLRYCLLAPLNMNIVIHNIIYKALYVIDILHISVRMLHVCVCVVCCLRVVRMFLGV